MRRAIPAFMLLILALIAIPFQMSHAQPPTATPEPNTPPAFTEEFVEIKIGPDTLYGTLTLPTTPGKHPAAVIIAGSGPTNREGNNPLIPGDVGTLRSFAHVLAESGVVSLRYDKVGSGATGLASYAKDPSGVDFELFVTHALAVYDFVLARPEVDPAKSLVVGHSDGGLIALVVADRLKAKGQPSALVLAAPISLPYLELIRKQTTDQFTAAVKAGVFTQAQADEALKELDAIIASLLEKGTPPETITFPSWKQLFGSPVNNKFMAQVGKYDPRQIAATVNLPTILWCGEFDIQVLCPDVQALRESFPAGNTGVQFFELKGVNHVFKTLEKPSDNPLADYGNPALPFSTEATAQLAAFVKQVFGQ